MTDPTTIPGSLADLLAIRDANKRLILVAKAYATGTGTLFDDAVSAAETALATIEGLLP